MKFKKLKKYKFYKDFFKINIPILISQSFLVVIGIMNSIIFGQLGEKSLASIAIVDKLNGIYWPILGAISTVVSIYFIQNYELNKRDEVKKTFILTIYLMTGIALLSLILFLVFGNYIISFYNKDYSLSKSTYIYLVSVGISNFFASLSFSIVAYLNGIGKIKETSFVGVIINVIGFILYYLAIIEGNDTKLHGILGLSIVIIAVKLIELLIYIMIYKTRYSLGLKKEKINIFREIKKLKDIFSYIVPLILNNITFMIAVNFIFIFFSRMGIIETASMGITDSLIGYFSLLLLGINTSSKIMIGRLLGKNKLSAAFVYGKKMIQIALLSSILCVGIINVVARFYLKFYKVDSVTLNLSLSLIFIASIIFIPKTVNGLIVDGILRVGGDIKKAIFNDLIGIIVFGVFVAMFFTGVYKTTILILYIAVNLNELLRCLLNYKRFKEKFWLRSIIK